MGILRGHSFWFIRYQYMTILTQWSFSIMVIQNHFFKLPNQLMSCTKSWAPSNVQQSENNEKNKSRKRIKETKLDFSSHLLFDRMDEWVWLTHTRIWQWVGKKKKSQSICAVSGPCGSLLIHNNSDNDQNNTYTMRFKPNGVRRLTHFSRHQIQTHFKSSYASLYKLICLLFFPPYSQQQ